LLEAGKIVPAIDKRYPLNKSPKRSDILEQDTPEEKWSSLWSIITKPNKALHLPLFEFWDMCYIIDP
jgi:hypothetical protein